MGTQRTQTLGVLMLLSATTAWLRFLLEPVSKGLVEGIPVLFPIYTLKTSLSMRTLASRLQIADISGLSRARVT